MKTIITLDKANQPYGYPQLNASGNFDNIIASGFTATTISATNYYNVNAVTGGTYSNGTITLSGTGNVNGTQITGFSTSSFSSGAYLPLSGGTVTGATTFQSGITANTISATTYYNLPTDVYVTGGTYTNGNAIFTNNTGGTFDVSGFAIGGGGGQIFYLNLSQSQNGNRLLSTTASTASEQTSGVTIGNGVTGSIASFQTTPLNISLIPGGIWSFYLHSYKQNSNASFNIFVEVYKITSGGSQTLLFTTDPTSVTTNSPNPSMQLTDGYFSGTPLNVSDGVVAVVKATNTGNQSHTITLVTEGSQHYSYVVSTIPTQQGLTCDTLSGCSIIQTINTNISNKFDKSGGTVSGATNFTGGLTANTISATTYFNLPTYVSAVTESANVITVTSNGGSPSTYTIDAVTGGTYNSSTGVITLSGTGSVNGNQITGFSTSTATAFTGGTVSGATNFTGGVTANTLTVSAATDPVKFVGLQSASDTSLLTVDGTGVIHTLSTSSVGLSWNNSTATQSATANNGYVGTATTLTTITLPSTAAFGTIVEVVGTGTGLWRISQNASQSIKFGVATTATGTAGYLSATSQCDCVKLLCTSANTTFVVTSSIGNIFYI